MRLTSNGVLGASLAIGISMATVVDATSALAASDVDASTLLKARTQAFSDSGQRGDGDAMSAMVDDRVVFFNEGGEQASKADLAQRGSQPPTGISIQMTVEDWNCEVHGDVAVTSFIDRQTKDFHGQRSEARFRSVETWQRAGGDWKMIASETLAIPDDPGAVTLAVATLDEYVGRYEAAPGVFATFIRKGNDIFVTNGGPLSLQKAEVRDVLFAPGRSRFRKVFQRDAAGRVVAFAFRNEGHDLIYRKVS